MWFIGVEVEQEPSAPPPKKILDAPLNGPKSLCGRLLSSVGSYDPTTATSMKTLLKNRLRILLDVFAIIPVRPVT